MLHAVEVPPPGRGRAGAPEAAARRAAAPAAAPYTGGMPSGLHHLAIQVADLAGCERFYREVLGLPVLRRWPGEAGGDRSVWLDLGGGAFLALERAGPGARPAAAPWRDGRPGLHLLALRIAAGERAGWERAARGGRGRGGGPDRLDPLPARSGGEPRRPLPPPGGGAVTPCSARRRYGATNYAYLLSAGEDAALVDPGDAAAALALADGAGLAPALDPPHPRPRRSHRRHRRGGGALRRRGAGPRRTTPAGYPPDRALADGERLRARGARGARPPRARPHPRLGAPGVRAAHLLTGDTLFGGGCGNCRNGGDPAVLARTFAAVLAGLDGALLVQPGHDYAAANLPFVLELEPGNRAAAARLAAVRGGGAGGAGAGGGHAGGGAPGQPLPAGGQPGGLRGAPGAARRLGGVAGRSALRAPGARRRGAARLSRPPPRPPRRSGGARPAAGPRRRGPPRGRPGRRPASGWPGFRTSRRRPGGPRCRA